VLHENIGDVLCGPMLAFFIVASNTLASLDDRSVAINQDASVVDDVFQ